MWRSVDEAERTYRGMNTGRSARVAVLLPLAFLTSVHIQAAYAEGPTCEEVIGKTAQMLAEKDHASARELIAARRDELARHKTEILDGLGGASDRHVRGAVRMVLCTILDTRDIQAVLARAEAADARAEADVLVILDSLARRSPWGVLPRPLDEWRSWWEANEYRLDLDAADCKKRALAAAPRYDSDKGLQKLADRLEKARGEEKWDIAWALDRIARFGSSDRPGPLSLVSPFIECLDDQSVDVRKSAARLLGILQDPRAVERLSGCLLSDPSQDSKLEYVAALESIGKPSASALMRALDAFVPADGPLRAQGDVLRRVCTALGNIGEAEAVPCLLRPLRNRHFANNYAWWAEQAVKRIGVPGIDYLVGHIGKSAGRHRPTGSGAYDSVGTCSNAREIVLRLIVDRFHYSDEFVSRDELKKRHTKMATPCIARMKHLLNGPDASKRLGSAICLAWLGDREAGEYLVSALQTSGQGLPRLDAIKAVGFTKSEEAVPVLLKLLGSKDTRSAQEAAESLGRIGSKAAVDDLLWIVSSRDTFPSPKDMRDVRLMQTAAYALGQIGDTRALPVLLKAARPKDRGHEYMREMPICALGHFSGEESLAVIVSGLSSHVREVRSAAVTALGTRGDPASVEWLIKTLSHEDSSLHYMAAEALGRIGDKRAVSALVPLLTREDWNSRLRAPVALMRIGDPSAIPALRRALNAPVNSDDYTVRNRIQEAINALEGAGGRK